MLRLVTLCAGLLLAVACGHPDLSPMPVEGSTYRIGVVEQAEKTEAHMKIYRHRGECRGDLGPENADACVPQLDRRTGQVKLAFRLESKDGDLIKLPLTEKEQVQISHMAAPQKNYEIVPHEPVPAAQLFVVLVDGSHSMHKAGEGEQKPIEKLYAALMNKGVIDGFFPKNSKEPRGVVLIWFTGNPGRMVIQNFDGGAPRVITSAREYRQMVQQYMMIGPRGWTWLYDATKYAATDLLREEHIASWLKVNGGEPTIVALTDGFNNVEGRDTCADNAPRLSEALDVLRESRKGPLGERPTVFTIGLGKPIRPGFKPKKTVTRISERDLCGAQYGHRTINSDLENEGIDNVSLHYLADVGGGRSFVKNDHRGLAKVFQAAAALRYKWYELIYRVDGFYHRRSFETRLKLQAFARAEATVTFHPDPWMDAPSGVQDGRWVEASPFRQTFALVMPLLGFLIVLAFWAPAGFNARRAVFRRAVASKGAPPATPPEQTSQDGQQPPTT